MDWLIKTYGRGCARYLIFQLLLLAAVLGLFLLPEVLAMLWGGDRDTRFSIFMGVLIVLMVLLIAGVAVWSLRHLRQRAARLDEVFGSLGMEGMPYQRVGRQYRGWVRGREMEVFFHRGPTLDFRISAPLQARAAIVFQGDVARFSASLGDYQEVALHSPRFRHLGIYAHDAAWMRAVLADERARQAVLSLMQASSAYEIRKITLTPDALQFTLRRTPVNVITSSMVDAWLDNLHTLLDAVAAAPVPRRLVQTQPLSLSSGDQSRAPLYWLFVAWGCGLVGLALACFWAFGVLISLGR